MKLTNYIFLIIGMCILRLVAYWPIHMAFYYIIRNDHSRSYYKKIRKEAPFLKRITQICFWNSVESYKVLARMLIVAKIYVICSMIIIPILFIILYLVTDIDSIRKIGESSYWFTAFIDCSTSICALWLRGKHLNRNS